MRKFITSLLFIYILLVSFTPIHAYSHPSVPEKKDVLILHSYHQDSDWTAALHDGLTSGSNSKNWNVFTEYLDSYRNSQPLMDLRRQRIREDYANKEIDAVIVTDDDAYKAILNLKEEVFPDTPVFFVGLNNTPSTSIDHENYTGLLQTTDMSGLLTLTSKAMPERNNLIIVGNQGITSQKTADALTDENTATGNYYKIQMVLDSDLDRQLDTLKQLADTNSIIYVTGSMDALDHDEYASLVADTANLPTFVGSSTAITGNVVGGYVIDPFTHGKTLQQMVNDYFSGTSVKDIPIITEPLESYIFNYIGMKKYTISRDLLPENSVIINQPSSTIPVDKKILILFGLATGIIVYILFLQIHLLHNKKQYTAELLDAKNKLQSAHDELQAHAEELVTSTETLEIQNSELQASKARIQFMAEFDEVTGFRKLASFKANLSSIIERNTPFSLVVLSLINLEQIRYTYEYGLQEDLLKILAKMLQEILPDKNCLWGIDESSGHILIVSFGNTDQLNRQLYAITNIFRSPFTSKFYSVYLTVKLGVALFPDHGIDSDQLLRHAGIAASSIYNNPNSGIAYYNRSMSLKGMNTQKMILDIDRALQEDEFILHLQPKYSPQTGDIVGYESLIRWLKDDRLIYPDAFIHVAEMTGQINRITALVADKTCRFIREQGLHQRNLTVSINLSPINLKNDGIISTITTIMESYELPYSAIELELTENCLLENFEQTNAILEAFLALGFTISLDDFGTGYSSLSYLTNLPINKIKVDRSFIQNIDKPNHLTIVATMINLAHDMGYTITLEGIETLEQLALLAPLNADEYQGYYFSKPLPLDGIAHELQKTELQHKSAVKGCGLFQF